MRIFSSTRSLLLVVMFSNILFMNVIFPQEGGYGAPETEIALEGNSPAGEKPDGKVWHVLMSLILPGSGEWMVGNRGLAKVFLGADLTLWLAYFGSREYVNILQSDLQTYAAVHAGVYTADKSDQYWIDIGTSLSIYDFNAEKLLERNIAATYPETDAFAWQWDSNQHRLEYLEKRIHRLDWKRTTTLISGILVLNRLVSAIDVIRLIRKSKSNGAERRQSVLYFNYARERWKGENVSLNFTWRF